MEKSDIKECHFCEMIIPQDVWKEKAVYESLIITCSQKYLPKICKWQPDLNQSCTECLEYLSNFHKNCLIWETNEIKIRKFEKQNTAPFVDLALVIKAKYDNSLICRLCLKETTKQEACLINNDLDGHYRKGYLKQIIELHTSFIDLNLTLNPVMCVTCLNAIQTFDAFYRMCDQTVTAREKTIISDENEKNGLKISNKLDATRRDNLQNGKKVEQLENDVEIFVISDDDDESELTQTSSKRKQTSPVINVKSETNMKSGETVQVRTLSTPKLSPKTIIKLKMPQTDQKITQMSANANLTSESNETIQIRTKPTPKIFIKRAPKRKHKGILKVDETCTKMLAASLNFKGNSSKTKEANNKNLTQTVENKQTDSETPADFDTKTTEFLGNTIPKGVVSSDADGYKVVEIDDSDSQDSDDDLIGNSYQKKRRENLEEFLVFDKESPGINSNAAESIANILRGELTKENDTELKDIEINTKLSNVIEQIAPESSKNQLDKVEATPNFEINMTSLKHMLENSSKNVVGTQNDVASEHDYTKSTANNKNSNSDFMSSYQEFLKGNVSSLREFRKGQMAQISNSQNTNRVINNNNDKIEDKRISERKYYVCFPYPLNDSNLDMLIFEDNEKLRTYVCNVCLVTLTQESQLRYHQCWTIKDQQNNRLYNCKKCPFVSTKKTVLRWHAESHNIKKSFHFKCNICEFCSTKMDPLTRHREVHLS